MVLMIDWVQIRHDLLAGWEFLVRHVVWFFRRAWQEVAVLESRWELARVERRLAEEHRDLGECAYEEWRHTGVHPGNTQSWQLRLDVIGELEVDRRERQQEVHECIGSSDLSYEAQASSDEATTRPR